MVASSSLVASAQLLGAVASLAALLACLSEEFPHLLNGMYVKSDLNHYCLEKQSKGCCVPRLELARESDR
jgi:hypothetical protein